ncbi:MAG: hypothetical protein CMQ40_03355 [Gammaproteobacteria bacterium]|nr:hypothetical protein [Gammaproteobacteria bacterium]
MFIQFGAGPFVISEHIELAEGEHRGAKTQFVHSSAYGQWGSVMVELVKQEDSSIQTPFREMFAAHEEGLHHTAIIVEDFRQAVEHFKSIGMTLTTRCITAHGGVEFGFIDATRTLGHMIEIYESSPKLTAFYDLIKTLAKNWDRQQLFVEP